LWLRRLRNRGIGGIPIDSNPSETTVEKVSDDKIKVIRKTHIPTKEIELTIFRNTSSRA